MIRIEELKKIGTAELEQLTALSLELHDGKRVPTPEDAEKMMQDKNTILMVVRDNERIIGMATLFIIQKLERRTAYLEDVVVAEAQRGHGVGKQLVAEVIKEAQRRNVSAISLTTQPKRTAANKLYESLGFAKRDTNVFRIDFS